MAKFKVVTPSGAGFTVPGGGYKLEMEALAPLDAEIVRAPVRRQRMEEALFVVGQVDRDLVEPDPGQLLMGEIGQVVRR